MSAKIDLDTQRYVKLGTTESKLARELEPELREKLEAGDELSVDGWSHVDGSWKCSVCEKHFDAFGGDLCFTCECCQESACENCFGVDRYGERREVCMGCDEAADERAYVRNLR